MVVVMSQQNASASRSRQGMTSIQHDLVQALFRNKDPNKKIREIKGIKLTGSDFWTLRHGEWLNDNIINAYMELIKERSAKNPQLPKVYTFTTYFYTSLKNRGYEGVERWTSKVDIFGFDLLLFPIHSTDHWSLVAIDLKKDEYGYFDSMAFPNDKTAVAVGREHIKRIFKYMKAESQAKRNRDYLRTNTLASTFNDPIQTNETDCGVFTCCFAENLACGYNFGDFDFGQRDISRLRRQICYELKTANLLRSV